MEAVSDSVQAFEDTMRSFDEIKCEAGYTGLHHFLNLFECQAVVNNNLSLHDSEIKKRERLQKERNQEIHKNKVTFKFNSNGQKGYKGNNWR